MAAPVLGPRLTAAMRSETRLEPTRPWLGRDWREFTNANPFAETVLARHGDTPWTDSKQHTGRPNPAV